MQIKIESIDRGNIVLSGGYAGYRGTFSCPIAVGPVVFIPSGGAESNLVAGNDICVESDQDSIRDFTVLTESSTFRLSPLPSLGDYDAIGQVEVNSEDEVFYIDIQGFSFILDVIDTEGLIPKSGDWVAFTISGLRLYDTNT